MSRPALGALAPEVHRARNLAVETERLALRAVLLRRRPTVERILSRALKLARVSLKEAQEILPPTNRHPMCRLTPRDFAEHRPATTPKVPA